MPDISRISIGIHSRRGGAVDPLTVLNFDVVLVNEDGVDEQYAHITWTANSSYETEIYRSLDGGAFALLTTVAPNIGEYDDQLMDGDEHEVEYYARHKEDLTVLNAPIGLTLSAISGGVRIVWDDNNTEADHIEIWSSIDSADYSLVTTVEDGVETYDNTVSFATDIKYKIRAKEGTLPVYSDYSEEETLTFADVIAELLEDGNTFGWYDSSDLSTITKDANELVARWNDKLGSGNDLLQAVDTNKPTYSSDGILFNGDDNSLSTGAKTLDQPCTVYLVDKQLTWTEADVILSGVSENAFYQQYGGTPNVRIFGGAASVTGTTLLNTFKIDRIIFNGANSKLQQNNAAASTGNIGTSALGGVKLAQRIIYFGNVQFKEVIVRKVADSSGNYDLIYNYLKSKYSL